jgi:hypothetical protein
MVTYKSLYSLDLFRRQDAAKSRRIIEPDLSAYHGMVGKRSTYLRLIGLEDYWLANIMEESRPSQIRITWHAGAYGKGMLPEVLGARKLYRKRLKNGNHLEQMGLVLF